MDRPRSGSFEREIEMKILCATALVLLSAVLGVNAAFAGTTVLYESNTAITLESKMADAGGCLEEHIGPADLTNTSLRELFSKAVSGLPAKERVINKVIYVQSDVSYSSCGDLIFFYSED